ncbi:MAG: phospho-sugar mutase, partial [Bacteroidota bacterium]
MDARTKAHKWLDAKNLDDQSRREVEELLSNEEELNEAFQNDLEFGTGGLRGIMGIGTSRMNRYTIGVATQGFSNYLKKQSDGPISVAIAHDSRNNSRTFAETTAKVFAANGIKVYLFDDLRPTPELSYTIRHLGCDGGVVLTASHNPKEYNGYKAYNSDGGQLIAPHDKNVIEEVSKIQSIDDVLFDADSSLIHELGEDMDRSYLDMIKGLSLLGRNTIEKSNLKIVFSPIHGTGIKLIPKALEELGYANVTGVDKQASPDGNFPTVVYPNPEEQEAMTLALEKGKEVDADIIMATDPDADRVGIAVKNSKGEFQLLNGNQAASLLIYYLLKKWSERGLKGNEFIAKPGGWNDTFVAAVERLCLDEQRCRARLVRGEALLISGRHKTAVDGVDRGTWALHTRREPRARTAMTRLRCAHIIEPKVLLAYARRRSFEFYLLLFVWKLT